jgi:hypothetical protein
MLHAADTHNRASDRRGLPTGGLLASRPFMSSSPLMGSGSASASRCRPRRDPTAWLIVLDRIQNYGLTFAWIGRHRRRTGPASITPLISGVSGRARCRSSPAAPSVSSSTSSFMRIYTAVRAEASCATARSPRPASVARSSGQISGSWVRTQTISHRQVHRDPGAVDQGLVGSGLGYLGRLATAATSRCFASMPLPRDLKKPRPGLSSGSNRLGMTAGRRVLPATDGGRPASER